MIAEVAQYYEVANTDELADLIRAHKLELIEILKSEAVNGINH